MLPYLDVPFQHAHPEVLKRMKRPANAEGARARAEVARDLSGPDDSQHVHRGLPGETEEQFETLLDFIREAELDRVGCFAYSPVEGATANELDGALPDEVREERRARFMEVAEEVSANRIQRKVGKTLKVLIDEVSEEGGIGRTAADAPEIDGSSMSSRRRRHRSATRSAISCP